ncbi:hypothetical protein D3C86_1960020 [compost metagenome]
MGRSPDREGRLGIAPTSAKNERASSAISRELRKLSSSRYLRSAGMPSAWAMSFSVELLPVICWFSSASTKQRGGCRMRAPRAEATADSPRNVS